MKLVLAALLLGVGCAQGGGSITVSGSVLYRERVALAPGAVVRVTLLDVSLIDAPARVIAEQEIRSTTQVPIPFTLIVERGAIDEDGRYGIRASIHDAEGRPLWITAHAEPVLPPSQVEIVLRQVGRLERQP